MVTNGPLPCPCQYWKITGFHLQEGDARKVFWWGGMDDFCEIGLMF